MISYWRARGDQMSDSTSCRNILLVGDDFGLPQLVKHVPRQYIAGIVASGIRPHHHSFLRQMALEVGVQFLVQPKAAAEEYSAFIDMVRRISPDLIIVHSYSLILRDDLLALSRFGAVNIHAAPLPKYRGCSPIQWAIINNENEAGVTLHCIDSELDHGAIIAQSLIDIDIDDTWLTVFLKIKDKLEGILAEFVPKLIVQDYDTVSQDESLATYSRRRSPDDGFMDWQASVRKNFNLIRALVSPLPGAFYFVGEEKRVVNSYKTLNEVAALKYSMESVGAMRGTSLSILPVSSIVPGLVLTEVDIKSIEIVVKALDSGVSLGKCLLSIIDFANGFGVLSVSDGLYALDSKRYVEVIRLCAEFAFSEIELNVLNVEVREDDKDIISLCNSIGFSRVISGTHSGKKEPKLKEKYVIMNLGKENYATK